jgi:23S rRNA (adenine2503-C2)-methyltransferase
MQKTKVQNIRNLSLADIEQYFETLGEKKFRARQVYEWLWLKPVQHFEQTERRFFVARIDC